MGDLLQSIGVVSWSIYRSNMASSIGNATLLYLLAFGLVFAICVECGSFRGNPSKRQISEDNNNNINNGQQKVEQHDLIDSIALSLETLDDSIENFNNNNTNNDSKRNSKRNSYSNINNNNNNNNNKRDEVSDAAGRHLLKPKCKLEYKCHYVRLSRRKICYWKKVCTSSG